MVEEEGEVGAEKMDKQEILEEGSKIQGNHNLFEEAGEGEQGEEDASQRSRRRRCMRRGKTWMKMRRKERGVTTSSLAPVALVCCDPETSAWAGRSLGKAGRKGPARMKTGKEEKTAQSLV